RLRSLLCIKPNVEKFRSAAADDVGILRTLIASCLRLLSGHDSHHNAIKIDIYKNM
ncbi:8136_t:CDS:1, partial [Gigaspora rosea]